MPNDAWSDAENDLIVENYFAMLAEDVSSNSCDNGFAFAWRHR